MSKASGLTHILTELASLDDLGQFTKRSTRLKYTGISVSRKYLALGSNKGGIYIFSRDTLKYLQVIFVDSETNPVTSLALSPTDQHLGVASSSGFVAVFELNIDKRTKPERVRHNLNHSGHTVTSITWDTTGSKLYVGDDQGRISAVFVPTNKSKTLFALPSEVMADLNVGVYQLTWWQDKLLVSTLTFCYLFDTVKHTYSTIGSKKREGEFGACIFIEPNSQCPVIYCARPGSRMWEVDFEGKVLNTHQLKQLLATPPVSVVNILSDSYVPSFKTPPKGGLSISFCKMIHVGRLILTWSSGGLYLFDPINVNVKIWTDSVKGIKDVSVLGNDIYVFSEQANITKLTLLPIYQAFQLLTNRTKWQLMAQLLLAADQINIQNAIVKRVKKDLLDDLFAGLAESGDCALIEKVRATMEDVSESSVDSLNLVDDLMGSNEILGYTRLPSGMIVVNEGTCAPQFSGHAQNGSYGKVGENEGKYDMRQEFSAYNSRCFSPSFKDERSRFSPYAYESQNVSSRATSPLETGHNQDENIRKNWKQMTAQYRSDNESPIPSSEPNNNNNAHATDKLSVTHLEDSFERDESTNDERSNVVCSPDGHLDHVENIEGSGPVSIVEAQSTFPTDAPVSEDDREELKHVETSEAMEGLSSQISDSLSGKVQTTDDISTADDSREKNTFWIEDSSPKTPMSASEIQDSNGKDEHDLGRDSPRNEIVVSSSKVGIQHDNDQLSRTSNTERYHGLSAKKQPPAFQDITENKGNNEAIAKSVKVGKKKPKAKRPSSSTMERSVSLQKLPSAGKMVTSRSCSDLSQKALYVFCDNEDVDVKLNMQESQDMEKEEMPHFPSNYRKHSVDNTEFYSSTEENAVSHIIPPKAKKEEVIPPLIDRLAASKVYSNTEEGTIEESWTGSVLAMKDELSSKLKTQTKSLLHKGRTLLVKSASSPHFSSVGVDSLRHAREEMAFQEDAILEASDSADDLSQTTRNPPISEKSEIHSSLANQIHSLCLKATKIEKKLRNHNILMNPSKMVQLLDNWAKELNKVSFEFHYLQWKKLREESEDLGIHENSADAVDASDDGTAVPGMRTVDMERMLSPTNPESDDSSNNLSENGLASYETDKTDSELTKQNHLDSLSCDKHENSSLHSNPKELPTHKISGIPCQYLKEIYQVSDPFHLSAEQLKVFQKLNSLCLLSGATGDIFNAFYLTESSQQIELFHSFLPAGLDTSLTNYSDLQLQGLKDCDRTKSDLQPNDIVDTPVSLDQSEEKHYNEEVNPSSGHSKLNGRKSELMTNEMLSDLQQALFLCLHFFAVDYSILKEEFDRRKDKLFLPWIALVRCSRENGKRDIVSSILVDNQINSAIDYLRSGILLHPSALLGHIYILFEHAPAKTSEFCGEIPSNISAPDVVRLCWLRSKSPLDALMRYGKKIMIDLATVQRPDAFKKMCENPIIRYLLLESLLPFVSLKRDEVAQGDSAKSLAIQFQNVLPLGWLRILVSMIRSDKERESFIHLGMKFRNWKLCVKLLADDNRRDQMFKLVACIGDLDLLQENCLPQTLGEWRILFKYCMEGMKKGNKNITGSHPSVEIENFDKISPEHENGTLDQVYNETASRTQKMRADPVDRDHQDKNSSEFKLTSKPVAAFKSVSEHGEISVSSPFPGKTISWNDLGRFMLKEVNGLTAVDLLLEFLEEIETNKDSLDPLLLNAFYTDFRILMEQDLLCHEALERMSVYMWTQKPSFMPPSLHHAIKSEALCKVNNEDELNLQSMMSRINLTSSSDFMEEHSGHHWGSNVNLEDFCPTCNIPLVAQLSVEVPGLFVFPCGHAFHKICVHNSKCPCMH